MKKRLTLAFLCVVCMALLAITASAAAPAPQKPDLDVEFGAVTTIDGFTPPSQLYVDTTERVLLTDGNGTYVTYPTYYITKDATKFDVDFTKINSVQSVQYTKASVVMLEIPNGITETAGGYFSGENFKSCQYVQFPGTLTTTGNNLFQVNKAAKIVEFVDGTTPVSFGNGMFSNNWAGGPVIEYVKFPNNMVSIGNNVFGKAYNLKTVVLGENIETISTGFFSESFSSGDKYIYAGKNLIKNTEGMFADFFGSFGQYNNKKLNIVLYTNSSEEEARAFVAAGKELKSDYIFADDRVSYYDASTYDYENNNYANTWGKLIVVYDVNECDAFYSSNHNTESEYVFTSFIDECYMNNVCTRCDKAEKGEIFAPIFTYHGYSSSYNTGKICVGYSVNKESLNAYGNDELSYGVVAYAPDTEETELEPVYVNDGVVCGIDGAVVAELSKGYASFDFVISGFETETHYSTALVMCMYIYDGAEVDYVCSVNGEAAQLELAQTVVFTDHVEEAE